jgi:hypothetical protein
MLLLGMGVCTAGFIVVRSLSIPQPLDSFYSFFLT